MPDVIRMQSMAKARLEHSKLCSFDSEVIEAPTPPLIHQEARFLYIKRGRGTLRIQNRSFELSAGELVAVFPWQITVVTKVTEPLQYHLIVYHLDTLNRLLKTFYSDEAEPEGWMLRAMNTPAVRCGKRAGENAERILAALKEEVGMESALYAPQKRPLASVATMNLLVELAVLFERAGREDAADYGARRTPPDRTELLRYMYAHCNGKLTLQTLSRVFYLSESAIRAYLTGLTGLSFFDLINEMRVGKTANYLLYTDFTLGELAEIMGYVDASHISKVFAARVGMQMGEYRDTYRSVAEMLRLEDGQTACELIEYIYRHYRQPLSARGVAARFSLSVPEMHRILLLQVERNFEEFLHYVRVRRACELLLSTDKSLVEIALEVGYHNTKTLTRNFLRNMVMTPGSYRKAARGTGETADTPRADALRDGG